MINRFFGSRALGVLMLLLGSSVVAYGQSVPLGPSSSGLSGLPSAAPAVGITSVVSGSAENNHVLKNSPGNLYSAYAVNLTATPGYLVILNSTTSPGDGAITPLACIYLPANGVASLNNKPGPPQVFATGITAVVTSATTCFTKTTGVITAFLSGDIQ